MSTAGATNIQWNPPWSGATVPALFQGGAMFLWVPAALLPSHPPSEWQVEWASKMQTSMSCCSLKQASPGPWDKVQTPLPAHIALPSWRPTFPSFPRHQPHKTASRLMYTITSLASISALTSLISSVWNNPLPLHWPAGVPSLGKTSPGRLPHILDWAGSPVTHSQSPLSLSLATFCIVYNAIQVRHSPDLLHIRNCGFQRVSG